jgi:transcriptional regulator with PAS, ATPase and Fis domain
VWVDLLNEERFLLPTGYKMMDIIDDVVDDPNHAIIIINKYGKIIFVNNCFLHQLGFRLEQVLGTYVDDLYPGKMMQTLKIGIPHKGYVFLVNGTYHIASSYPIYRDGKIKGAIGRSIFLNLVDASEFSKMISQLEAEFIKAKDLDYELHSRRSSFDSIIGKSPIFLKIKSLAKGFAKTDSTVLITGESGTGKDLFAKAIHYNSERKNGPFIRINCAAIPEQLLESELFGYNEGTFTGAIKGGKKGKFELANKGTIFLDEIGEMPLSMQAKLLVVLQEKEIEPLGSQTLFPKKIDVRIIAATNQDLHKLVADGKFRQDLYYRLNVINLNLPPLRYRKDDIPMLSKYILEKVLKRINNNNIAFDSEAIGLMNDYNWPGNVRELENYIERSASMANIEGRSTIGQECIAELINLSISNPSFHSTGNLLSISQGGKLPTLKEYIDLCEKRLLEEALRSTNGDKNAAAQILDLHISALYKKINKHGLK